MRYRLLSSLVAVALVVAAPTVVLAQRTTASVRGTVTDSSHALVPGATVTVTNNDTGFNRSAVTNADGVYTVSEIPVGKYTISVTLQGFKTATRTDIALHVAD